MREHLEAVAKMTGKRSKDLDPPNIPWRLAHIYSWFCQLDKQRQSGINGPLPISHAELESWQRLTGRELTPFEVDAITQLDQTYLSEWAEAQNVKQPAANRDFGQGRVQRGPRKR